MKKIFTILLTSLLLIQCKSTGKNPGATKNSDLANIAVLKYLDETGSPNLEYLSPSLTSATNDSMTGKFQFNKIEAKGASQSFTSKEQFEKYANQLDADVLIYGRFNKTTRRKNSIEITVKIYMREGNKYIGEISQVSRIDSSLFKKVEQIAQEVVQLVLAFATKQAKEELKPEAAGKIALTKERLGIVPLIPPVF